MCVSALYSLNKKELPKNAEICIQGESLINLSKVNGRNVDMNSSKSVFAIRRMNSLGRKHLLAPSSGRHIQV